MFKKSIIDRYDYSTPNVLIHPGASWHGRHWKPERFSQVADLIIKYQNANVIIAGSISDIKVAEKICSKMKYKAMMVAGRLSIREFIGLIERCDVFLGLDSGPMHMASATNIRIVTLFGPAYADAVGPRGNKHIIIITHQDDFSCSPCSQTICKKSGNSCMDAIHVDEVYSAVIKQIKDCRYAKRKYGSL